MLLSPDDFGLFGIAMLSISALDTFSQTGFQAALIHKKSPNKYYLNTAWTVSIIRGVVLYTILTLFAPAIANFFDTTQAVLAIRVIAISTLISGFKNIGIIYFQKELEFNKQFLYAFSVAFIELITSIFLALLLRNVWALIYGGVAGSLIAVVMSFYLHPYKPKFEFSFTIFKELLGFGKWILWSSIIIFFASQGDNAFVGKVLGVTALGFYQMAFNIGNLPSSEITGVISKVAFPAYVKMNHDSDYLREAYLRTLTFVILLSAPIAGGIIAIAPQFTELFLGEKWLPIVTPMQIIALAGLFRSLAGTGGTIFKAIGKPEVDFKKDTARLVAMALSIYPLTKIWGLSGTAVSVLLGNVVSCSYWFLASIRETQTSVRDHLLVIIPPVVGSALMCSCAMVFLRINEYTGNPILIFNGAALLSIITYLGTMYLMQKGLIYGGLQELKYFIKESRG
jgi:O-antigen/teichoic acid export membrane protein